MPIETMRRHPRLMLVISIVAGLAMLSTGALFLREIDLSRIEAEQVDINTAASVKQGQTIRVLCARGYILIDLIDGALVLIGQRLIADTREGNDAAVRADRQFLSQFVENREQLVAELTDPESPCAMP